MSAQHDHLGEDPEAADLAAAAAAGELVFGAPIDADSVLPPRSDPEPRG
ncbi:hypothetical protein LTV02_23345 [Nocardia yamanashiensis]|nr:hypothetical protein [Nocardia yamanashiensis]UGT39027.1 hypothetical protein LTV02_23345 [Nocardia yamanashiensis]